MKKQSEMIQVTHKGGRDESKRRSVIGEDERQPMMARFAAR